uniref:NRAMP family divalent metal transporter n=1 Tax=Kytococcus sedentarius TaxID=1276 RepID=UPI004043B956
MATHLAGDAPSTTRSRLAALGPGLLMASAAIGGSHLVSSTQAGAIYQWQLVAVVVLANLLKYPFYRFGAQHTAETGRNLVHEYARRGRVYLWVFFALIIASSVISTAGVGILAAVILQFVLPDAWAPSVPWAAGGMMLSIWLILVAGRFRLLDAVTKAIIVFLTVVTVATVVVAAAKGSQAAADAVPPSPWTLTALPFLVALAGWMPAAIEMSALQSLWITEKQSSRRSSVRDVVWDFNVGYLVSTVLAVFFVAMGALVQFGTGTEIQQAGGAYIPQLISMYTATMGEWARPLMGLLALVVMYGTTLTLVDGYGRACAESLHQVRRSPGSAGRGTVLVWSTVIAVASLLLVVWFSAQMGEMLRFAMIASFVTAPVFAWLNYSLVRRRPMPLWLRVLAWAGFAFLGGFTLLFLAAEVGLVG